MDNVDLRNCELLNDNPNVSHGRPYDLLVRNTPETLPQTIQDPTIALNCPTELDGKVDAEHRDSTIELS